MPTAERHDNLIVVQSDWRDKELIKLIPGSRWGNDNRVWTTPLSWAACLQLRGVFGDRLTVGPELTSWSWSDFNSRVKPSLSVREAVASSGADSSSSDLYPFQAAGVEWFLAAGSGVLGDELGTGKTVTTLSALDKICATDLPALVICPNSVKTNWASHASTWCPSATPYVITGGAANGRKTLAKAAEDPTALVIVNIESVRLLSRLAPFGNVALKKCRECDPRYGQEDLKTSRCEVHKKELNGFGFKLVIIDEAHRIKNPSAAQTRACWAVGDDSSVQRRWALTGTPISNNVGDLWAIMRFVAPHEWPTKSKWVDRYALTSWNKYGGLDLIGLNPQTRHEFEQIFFPRFRRTPKALVLDQLPKVVRSTRWVQLTPKQKKAYDELEKRLITRLDDGQILIAPNNLVKATRLLQLAASYANVEWIEQKLTVLDTCMCYGLGFDAHVDECPRKLKIQVTLTEPSPKLDVMEEVIEERGDAPLVVSAVSRQLINLAAKRLEKLKIPHGLIVGGVPEYERQQVLDRFKRSELQVVLFTLQAGGTGVDGLQHSDTMLCLQRSWAMIENIQGDGRVDRIGSEKHESVHIIDVVADDTVETEALYPRLRHKFALLDEINRDRARLASAGKTPEVNSFETVLAERESRIASSNLGEPDNIPGSVNIDI